MHLLQERLHALSERFWQGLPLRIDSIRDLLRLLRDNPGSRSMLNELERHFHSLSGTAGQHRFAAIAALSAEGEAVCCEASGAVGAEELAYLSSIVEELQESSGVIEIRERHLPSLSTELEMENRS